METIIHFFYFAATFLAEETRIKFIYNNVSNLHYMSVQSLKDGTLSFNFSVSYIRNSNRILFNTFYLNKLNRQKQPNNV